MSARRRRIAGHFPAPPANPDRLVELWWQAAGLRDEWLAHALRAEPADRPTAQAAITRLYALADLPPPEFVWVGSPAAAARMLPPPGPVTSGGPWEPEARLATLISRLRHRLGERIGRPESTASLFASHHPRPPTSADPVAALCAGRPIHQLLNEHIRGGLGRVVRNSIAGLLHAALRTRLGVTFHGQHDVDWVAHYDAHRRVLGTRFAEADVELLELCATLVRSCGWWWPRAGRCMISERPSVVRTEPTPGAASPEPRPHDPDGPSIGFPDGWAVHAWHGMRVPGWVIEAPTVARIAAESNAEVRRCAMEHIGWPTFVVEAGLSPLGRAADPGNPGHDLVLYDLPPGWVGRARLLFAVNGSPERDGTRRRYGLYVPHWLTDPIDAAAWSYGLSGPQYARLQRRT